MTAQQTGPAGWNIGNDDQDFNNEKLAEIEREIGPALFSIAEYIGHKSGAGDTESLKTLGYLLADMMNRGLDYLSGKLQFGKSIDSNSKN